jgi:CHAD domain-containing protein
MRREANSIHSTINGRAVADHGAFPPDTLKVLTRSLKSRWKRYCKQLRKCQRKMSERAVHDLRVEARRVLSLLDLLEPFLTAGRLSDARDALKCHLDTFDDLRDVQVQLAAVEKLRKGEPAVRDFHRFLETRETRIQRRTCKRAKRLHNEALADLIAACGVDAKDWLKRSSSGQANFILFTELSGAFGAMTKLKKRIDPNVPRSIHRTRIAFKKFRYSVEAFAHQLSWVNERLLENMRHYQGLMGDIQDAEVLRKAYQKYVRKEKPDARLVLRFSNRLLRQRQRLVARYLAAADRSQKFEPPSGFLTTKRGKVRNPHGSPARQTPPAPIDTVPL